MTWEGVLVALVIGTVAFFAGWRWGRKQALDTMWARPPIGRSEGWSEHGVGDDIRWGSHRKV